MRSILLIGAGILLIILAIKKYTAHVAAVKHEQGATANSNVIKNTPAILPEDLKMMQFYNY